MPKTVTATETVEAAPVTTPQAAQAATTTETVTVETGADATGETAEAKAERIAKELEGAQKRIAELNKENEKRRLAEKDAAEKKLAEEGKLQELVELRATERDAKAAELETASQKLTRLNEILGADVDKRIEKWPDEVKKLVPTGEGVDALTRFEKVSELAPLAERLMNVAPRPGNGAGPTPSGGPGGNTVDTPRPANYRI